jgi:uncharacterized membrane protein (UPF0127 family)
MFTPNDSDPAARRKRIYVLIAMALFLVSGSYFLTGSNDVDYIVVKFPSGHMIEAEVSDTPEKILFGLAFRDGLPREGGMLYIFDVSAAHTVSTKGFKFPVDVIWIDESRHVVHMQEQVAPCPKDPCPEYGPPPEHARYVLETNTGFIQSEQVTKDMELSFALRL